MATSEKNSKAKLVFSVLALMLSVGCIGGAAYCFTHTEFVNDREYALTENGIVLIVIAIALMCFAHFLAWNYRRNAERVGPFCMILYVLTFLQFWIVLGIIYLGYKIFRYMSEHADTSTSSSSQTTQKWELRDEYGSTRTLEKSSSVVYEDGKQYTVYRDDCGNSWLSNDEKNFHRKKY